MSDLTMTDEFNYNDHEIQKHLSSSSFYLGRLQDVVVIKSHGTPSALFYFVALKNNPAAKNNQK